jgi:hypothetical protein
VKKRCDDGERIRINYVEVEKRNKEKLMNEKKKNKSTTGEELVVTMYEQWQ